jgi:cell division protein FtsN
MPQNVRRNVTEPYNPKQRLVGGIVLFLLMLFIYGSLKLVLGFSLGSEDKYKLSPALEIEETSTETDSENGTLALSTSKPRSSQIKSSYLMPEQFVFLDLNGKPMEIVPMVVHQEKIDPDKLFEQGVGDERWYVQVASFKEEESAQRLIEKIKTKNIADKAYIFHRGNWYAVRLHPTTQDSANQQKRELRRRLRLRPIIREIK